MFYDMLVLKRHQVLLCTKDKEIFKSGIPEQKDGKTCAYLVMRYMKDIIADKDLEFATTWKTKQGIRYTPDQIDEVWAEWAKQVLMFKV
ncbi:hypothetical protein ACLB2K_038585 [Fragaria x ananassa]